jgi:APA family basic amino acid/polyamine antiporter
MESDEKKVFVRKATGLTKGVSAFDVFSYMMVSIAPLFYIAGAFTILPPSYPGVDLTVLLLVMAIPLACFTFNCCVLASVMARTGGDYVFGSRVVHPIWGLISSTQLVALQTWTSGGLPALAFLFLAPALMNTFPNNPGLVAAANSLMSDPTTIFIWSTIIIAVLYAIPMLSTKGWLWWLRISQIIILAAIVVFIGSLLTANPSTFVGNFNNYAASYKLSFQGVFDAAANSGWSLTSFTWLATFAGIIFGTTYFFTLGPTYFGGEVKEGHKNLPIGLGVAIAATFILALVMTLAWGRVIPFDFMAALGSISSTPAYTLPAPFSIDLLLRILVQNPWVPFLLGIGIFLNIISWIATANVVNSRAVFGWAFDRLIPQKFASVNRRTRTPVFTLFVMAVLTWIGLLVFLYMSNIFTWMTNTGVMFTISVLPSGFSAALLPYRRKDLWEKAPSWATKKIGGLPVVVITGLIHGVSLVLLLVSLIFIFPQIGGPITPGSVGLILLVVVFAFLLYFIPKWYRMKKEGIDISWAYKEIPPA